jgi:squalene-hopene/tetraprenyl-beta-curcumene cyclase
MTRNRCGLLSLAALLLALCLSRADEAKEQPKPNYPRPSATSSDEPLAAQFRPDKAASFLDGVAVNWTRDRNCGTCHTNYPYLLSRPLLSERSALPVQEVRGFFEHRVGNWDSGKKGDAPRWDAEVVATAATLALDDARSGKLNPLTRQALDRMWTLQKPHGAWNWLKCNWPPYEHDDYYGATYAAVGAGYAPGGYAKTEKAKLGLEKLREYFKNTPPPDLHHKTMLLWASVRLEALMTAETKAATIKQLLVLQHDDGGWSLPSLGEWKRRDNTPNDAKAASDGYGTGFVVFVLRQAGLPADSEQIRKGVDWLRTHQRESGRWFTRSLNNDRAHYITNAGTSFAVLALHSCGALQP